MFWTNYPLTHYGMDFNPEVIFLIKLVNHGNTGSWYLQNISETNSTNGDKIVTIHWSQFRQNCVMFDHDKDANDIMAEFLSDRDVEKEEFVVGDMM